MYQNVPITPRIQRIRDHYRNTTPEIDVTRYRLITDWYHEHPDVTGIIKRADCLRHLFDNMPTPIFEDELIVGYPANKYRACSLYPEISFYWMDDEIDRLETRKTDPYLITEENREYIRETKDFWKKHSMSAIIDTYLPTEYKNLYGNGVLTFVNKGNCQHPIGHYCGNFWKVVNPGLGAILEEARAKRKALLDKGILGDEGRQYEFYRAVETVTEGLILYVKRYAKEAARQAAECTDPKRKAELLQMADSLDWIMEKPARTFQEALQAVWFYQMAQLIDGEPHGVSFGRIDQYVGEYAERDIASGLITREFAQEITDSFMMKVTECNKCWSEKATKSGPGYTTGQMMTIGGVDKDGKDSTNVMTYMVLQSSARLKIHQPPVSIRIHDETPDELWEAAIGCNMQVGGVPCFEYDDVCIEAMMKRGIPLEDARNYCLIGCVEPAITGCDFANSGGEGNAAYFILPNALWAAINNGENPKALPNKPDIPSGAPKTGYLYDMKSMDEVVKAFETQMEFFTRWQVSMVNCYEYIYSFHNPLPLLSATMDGCMEKGLDVMWGGAKYNGSGNTTIGFGTCADSLNIIDQLCFKEKKCTTRELYDALIANWEGYEELHQYILGRAKHYGNDDDEADKYVKVVSDAYTKGILRGRSPRGCNWTAGIWPVTLNIVWGTLSQATPDGRKTGEQLSDGISPVPGMDKNGPFACINSMSKFDQTDYGNGTLCNMKFHPTSLQGEGGWKKLRDVMMTYFKKGGLELQLNIVSSDTLRAAQKNPENYRDLVVRIAGFSAYFVEVFKDAQDALIERTEMSL